MYHMLIMKLMKATQYLEMHPLSFFLSLQMTFLAEFISFPIISSMSLQVSLISFGKFSENISSILVTKPRATKLLMIIESYSVYPMAKMRTTSVKIGEMICIVHKMMLIILPLFPPLAVLTYLRYLKTLRACLNSPQIIICKRSAQIILIALPSALGNTQPFTPISRMKKSGTRSWTPKTMKHYLRAKPCCNGEQHFVIFAQIV